MRHRWSRPIRSSLPVLAILNLIGAAPPGMATANDPEPTPATQYRALVREYQDAQQVFFKALGAAKTDAERRKALARKPNPADHAGRFIELAKARPSDPAAFDALNWVLTYSPHGAAADEALE